MKDHSAKHWRTALHILEYLSSTKYDGLRLKKPETDELAVDIYADASYGREESRSQTGMMITPGEQLVG